MKKLLLLGAGLLLAAAGLQAQASVVKTVQDDQGWRLQVDDQDFAVKGIVWSYTPVGENYTYDLFAQPEDDITRTIDTDMALLKAMGVNAVRCFSTIPPQWVEYIYDRYGIYTMVNDLFGRYGVTVDGRWQMPTDYSDPATRRTLLAQAKKTFETYKDTRGVLLYMLGNESNYGLEWTSATIENLPGGEQAEYKAKALYSLFQEAFALGKKIDPNHPMGLINGDLQYMRVMKDLVPDLDILGVNTYRGGQSFDGFYQSIAKDLGKPFVYTEFGADAYNVATEQEDQDAQARLVLSQWKEVYSQAYAKGKSANCLGGFVFEWMDEWWKAGMETGLTVHDTNGTWSNGGYTFDAVPGRNNMNEEWFGIVGQSLNTVEGVPRRLPRTTYYALKDLWRLDLYTSTKEQVAKAFAGLDFAGASSQGNLAQLRDSSTDPHPVFTPHGSVTSRTYFNTNSADWKASGTSGITADTGSTLFFGGDLRGPEGLTGSFKLRVLPTTDPLKATIDSSVAPELAAPLKTSSQDYKQTVELYQATIDYQSPAVTAALHYHDGHPDWAAQGDFFGLLPEAYDLYSMDIGGSKAPFGVEFTFPEAIPGLTVYGGPEVFWGAQPQVLARYSRTFGAFGLNLVHDEEYGIEPSTAHATVANQTADRWTEAMLSFEAPRLVKLEVGGLLAQPNRVGSVDHTYSKIVAGAQSLNNQFTWADALEGKLRVTSDAVPYVRFQLTGLYAGLLADTREAMPREGSQISDVGTGNRMEAQAMVQAVVGDFVLRTTGVARKPLIGALVDSGLGLTGRTPLDDEFYVWKNRETYQAEGVLTWDPTGATYFHDWNNDDREDSKLSASVGLLYNFFQGQTDRYKYLSSTDTNQAFLHGLPEVRGTYSAKARIAGRPLPGLRLALSGTAGKDQSTGGDKYNTPSTQADRLTEYWTVSGKAAWGQLLLEGSFAKNSWGPFGWQREWNFGYPTMWMAGAAWGLKPLSFLTDSDRIGLRFSGKTFGDYSGDDETNSGAYTSRFTAELYAGWSF